MLFNISISLSVFTILVILSVYDIKYRLVPPAGWMAVGAAGIIEMIHDAVSAILEIGLYKINDNISTFADTVRLKMQGGVLSDYGSGFSNIGEGAVLFNKIVVSIIYDINIMFHVKGFAVIFTISFLLALITNGLGGGDIKLFSAIGFTFGAHISIQILIFSFLLSGFFIAASVILRQLGRIIPIFSRITRFSELPFVPFITISFILIFIENLLY